MLKIGLDAGHWLYEPGRRCLKAFDPCETREWQLNDRVARFTEQMLSFYECEVVRLDDPTGQKEILLEERVRTANESELDVVVSIHHNGGADGTESGGTVVYCSKNASEYSLQLQKALYHYAIQKAGLKGNRANPMPQAAHYITTYTKMPSVLIECGFMDSSVDVPVILTDEFARGIADSIVTALTEIFYLSAVPTFNPAPWSSEAREWAESAGLISGYGDGTMGYDKPVTREELVVILHKFNQLLNGGD